MTPAAQTSVPAVDRAQQRDVRGRYRPGSVAFGHPPLDLLNRQRQQRGQRRHARQAEHLALVPDPDQR